MRLVLFEGPGAGRGIRPGLLTEAGVVDLSATTADIVAHSPQRLMEQVIDRFDELRPAFERAVSDALPLPLDVIRLRPPLPRPGKILCCVANYWEHAQREARPLNMFLKNPDAVIGPGDTIVLPDYTDPWVFQHEAELAIVARGPAKNVKQPDWRRAVFGFTGLIDVSARADGRRTWRSGSWMGKSFDTFAPIGPCITTTDEIGDPNKLWVKFWNNGELRHDYVTDDMEHHIPELIEFATTIMTLNSGDLIACGTNHEGLGPLQDGEVCDFELEKIGRMTVHVRDPLKRQWERGIYMGSDSTNPAARQQRGEA